jgi:NNP family nitrate/nitrite transporter-like MFS transporter
MGGGVTQIVMPLVFTAFASGLGAFWGWRLAMMAAGTVCFMTGIAYYALTQDAPDGDAPRPRSRDGAARAGFLEAARDRRVWALFVLYGACFGVELTMDNILALYYADNFGLGLRAAGLAAGSLGLLHLFARTLGGYASDRIGGRWGLRGRVRWLFAALLGQGLALMLFSRMTVLAAAIPAVLLFGIFMKMSEGATFAIVPFVSRRALGSVAGIVGAGGNAGAVAAGFLFKGGLAWPTALLILGAVVCAAAFLALGVRFCEVTEAEAAREFAAAVAARRRESVPAGALA